MERIFLPLKDDVRLGEALLDVAARDFLGRRHARKVVVEGRCRRIRCIVDLDRIRQRLDLDANSLQRRRRDSLRDGRDSGNRFTLEADPVPWKYVDLGLIVRQVGCARHVVRRDDRFHPRHLDCCAHVDGQNARVVMTAAQQLAVKHSRHLQVGSVFRRSVHGRRAVEPRDADADGMAVGQRRRHRRLSGSDELGCVFDRLDDLDVAGTLDLDAPVRRLGAPDVPMPCNDALERATIPSVEEDYGGGSEACGVPATRRSPICPSTRASRSLTSETP